MNFLDIATLISYFALNIDILLQINRIYRTKSSQDLSLLGMSVRHIAIMIILAKLISLSDIPLIVGQGLIAVTFTTYISLAIYYHYRQSHGRNTF